MIALFATTIDIFDWMNLACQPPVAARVALPTLKSVIATDESVFGASAARFDQLIASILERQRDPTAPAANQMSDSDSVLTTRSTASNSLSPPALSSFKLDLLSPHFPLKSSTAALITAPK